MHSLTEEEISRRLNSFEKECRRRGLRVTNQRREIFKTVASSRQHPSAEAVFSAVRKKMANVSLDTVYRTLASLEKMNLLIRVGTPEKERFDGDLRPHAHFICTCCGEVYDVFPPAGTFQVPGALECGQVKRVNVQLKGICKRCSCSAHGVI
ncbi:MAG: transcriptional repressor [Elusimicrobiaceae bacterium]|nr:transcriptional repressor [Elusimicrobiaceae bacterium]